MTDIRRDRIELTFRFILIAFCIWFTMSFAFFISNSGTGSVDLDQAVYNYYAYGGFAVISLFGTLLLSFARGRYGAAFTQFFLWGTMLFSFNYATQFFANVFNLKLMTFKQGLTYLSDYLPSLILCVCIVAVLSQWNTVHRSIVAIILWVGLLASCFLSAYVIVYVASVTKPADMSSLYSGMFQITHAVIVPLAVGWLYLAVRSGRIMSIISSSLTEQEETVKDETVKEEGTHEDSRGDV